MPDTRNVKDCLELPLTNFWIFTLKNVTWRTYLISFTVQYCYLFRFVFIELVSLIWFLQIWVAIYVYGTIICIGLMGFKQKQLISFSKWPVPSTCSDFRKATSQSKLEWRIYFTSCWSQTNTRDGRLRASQSFDWTHWKAMPKTVIAQVSS